MSTQVPERLTNFKLYNDGHVLLGTVDIELPTIAYMTDTISGAGIAGEIDSIVKGHTQSMTATINWRTVNKQATVLAAPRIHAIDARGSQEVFDRSTGLKASKPVKVSMRAQPKEVSLGTFAVGQQTGTSNQFEVIYLLVEVEGERVVEIDKFNEIFFVDGQDWLQDVRDQT